MRYNRLNIIPHTEAVLEAAKKFVKEVLYPACLIFTIVIFIFTVMLESSALEISGSFTIAGLIQFFAFSLIFSWSNKIYSVKKMSRAKKHLLNYAAFLLNVTVSFVILGNRGKLFGTLIVFSLLYLVISLIYAVIRAITKKIGAKGKNEYKKLYK